MNEQAKSLNDANLSLEASGVYQDTGLTPRQLAEQRKELMEALDSAIGNLANIGIPKDARGNYDKNGNWTFTNAVPRSVDAAEVHEAFRVLRDALAKAEGRS